MQTSNILETLLSGTNLPPDMAQIAFSRMMDGEMTPLQAGSMLIALRQKGETPHEIATAVSVCLKRALPVPEITGKYIDVVGTGGDGKNSFNCSTATALTLAGMGHTVVKHGNRAVSSSCGSADAIEGLGLPLNLTPKDIAPETVKRNFAFLFAPNFHPAFRHIMPVRRELGVRTLFNLLGPLLNPARPTHQLLGVAKKEHLELMADVLALSGIERAAVVHGAGGYDELTPMGPAHVIFVEKGKTHRTTIDPAQLGIAPCSPEELSVTGKKEGLAVLQKLLHGQGPKAMQEMLILNVGICIHLLENTPMEQSIHAARNAVCSGVAKGVINA